MARLELVIKGDPQDHVVRSDSLSDEVAAQQLKLVGELIGRQDHITLPWLVTSGPQVRFARIIRDEPTVQASAGRTIMGDLASERF